MKRITLALLTAFVLLISSTGATHAETLPSTNAMPTSLVPYEFINYNSGKCAGVQAASVNNNAVLVQTACDSTSPADQWYISTAASGSFYLVNVNSGKCAMPYSSTTYPGAAVVQYNCGAAAGLWKFSATSIPGYDVIYNLNSLLCLDVKDGATIDGANLVQSTCSSSRSSEFWTH